MTQRNVANLQKETPMAKLDDLLEELVTGNRILAREGVVDSFGHISVRHPDNPQHYLLSRSRAPDCIEKDDIMEFTLDGTPVDAGGRAPYLERFIHGALYEARPDVMSVVHNHSESVIPFGVTGKKIKPIFHMGASIGHEVPVWDSHDHFGDTALLVENMEMGRDLAKLMGAERHRADARPWRNRRGQEHPSRRLYLGLSRGQRAAAEAGHGHGRGPVPDRGRGRQGCVAHRLVRHQPRLGKLVSAGEPAVAGGTGLKLRAGLGKPTAG